MKKIITGMTLFAAPMFVFAQTTAFSILAVISNILRILPKILIAAGFVYFIWGVIKYLISDDADDKEKAKKVVTNGIIGLFIILSIWGIIGIIGSTFGIGAGGEVSDSIPSVF
jgi:hypothetical protein